MNHDEIRMLVSAYKDGETNPEQTMFVKEHLNTCALCRQDMAAYMSIASSLKAMPQESLSPDEEMKIQKQISQRREPMKTPKLKPVVVTLALAVFVVSSTLLSKTYFSGGHETPAKDKTAPVTLTANTPAAQATKAQQVVERKQMAKVSSPQNLFFYNKSMGRLKSTAEDYGSGVGDSMVMAVTDSSRNFQTAYSSVEQEYAPSFYNGSIYYPQQVQPNSTEDYSTITENEFLASKENPLSTFSIDVDTASYSNLRRFLNMGQRPPKDAVRIEEMINYFTYHYEEPKGEDPFAIHTEVAACPWNSKHQLAMIGLQGKKVAMENLPPANLTFLIDVSGSMAEPNKLPLVQSSLRLLVEQMRPQDKVAMVVYAGQAGLVLQPTAGNLKEQILSSIDRLQAGGSTAGGQGIELAYKVAKDNLISNGNNRVILATDGDFNVGVSSDAELVRMIEEKRDQGIYLTVLGFGMGNYKDNKMEQLADKGNGNYAYIDSLQEARKVLVQQMGGTLLTIAKDVKIQVEFNPSTVKSYKLIGYENRMMKKEDFKNDKKDAGELGAGHTVTALYEIIPADSVEAVQGTDPLKYQQATVVPSHDLMTVKLRYKNPTESVSKEIIRTLGADQLSTQPSTDFQWAASVAETGLLLRESPDKANASFLHALETARNSKGEDLQGYRQEFITLIEKAGLVHMATTTPQDNQPEIMGYGK